MESFKYVAVVFYQKNRPPEKNTDLLEVEKV